MAFKVVIEQIELANALRRIRGTTGKGKGTGAEVNEKYLYASVIAGKDPKQRALKLITSNSVESSQVFVKIVSGEVGEAPLIEFDKIASIVGTIDDSIEITLEDLTDGRVSMTYVGRQKPIIFNCVDVLTYTMPPVVKATDIIHVPMAVLKEGLDVASTIIHDDDKYPIFNCVNISTTANQVEFTAVDSNLKRMAVFNRAAQVGKDVSFFLPCNKVRRMTQGFDTTKDVIIKNDGTNVVLIQDAMVLTLRLVNGKFPDCNKFMPAQYKIEATFNKAEMLASLTRAKIMMDQNSAMSKSCVFHIDAGFTSINLNSAYGSLAEMVMTNLQGDPIEAAFFVDSTISVLNSFNEENLKICFNNNTCGIVMPVAPTGYNQKVYMPAVRLTN